MIVVKGKDIVDKCSLIDYNVSMTVWKDPGLFTTYTDVEMDGYRFYVERDGTIEIEAPGGYHGDDVYTTLKTDDLEKMIVMAKAVKEWYGE